MQKHLIFIAISIIFISGCVALENIPGFKKAEIGLGLTTRENSDISIKVEAYPSEVKSGKNTTLFFTLENKQPNIDLKNITLNVYDPCLFEGSETPIDNLELKSNRTKEVSAKYKALKTDLARNCEIKFSTTYIGTFSLLQPIAVLEETEYVNRERQGTLGQINTQPTSTTNPLVISLTFSENQPFITDDTIYMYIDYSYSGDGFIDKIDSSSISITVPENLESINCNDYTQIGNILYLNKTLTFINNKAPRSTCTFKTRAGQALDIKTLTLIVNYKYTLDNSIIVKIKPR